MPIRYCQNKEILLAYIFPAANTAKKTIFDTLAEGADKDKRTFMDLHDMPFGTYGQLTNKYGVSWIFVRQKKE